MVKNESKHLEECLASLEPIREELDTELVIVDTGSDDNTVEIAKQFTDKVYFHEWNDNFSEMRNTVISYAKGDWYFSLDGDEIVNNPEGFIDFFKSGRYKKFNTALVTQKNYTNLKENRFSKILVPRVFKNDDDFHFEGAVHNQPQYKKPIIALDTILDHYGYVTSDPELIERKFQRTSNILKDELEKDPENIYYWFQLSKSYNMHKDQEDALEAIEKAYEVAKKNNLVLKKRMYVYIQLSKMYLVNNRYKKSEKIAKEALAAKDGYVDLYYYLARAQLMQGKKEESLENFKEYINLINNYDQTNSKIDTSVDDETMGNYNLAYRFIVALAADLEIETDYAIKSAFKIELDSQLQHVIHPFMSICLNSNEYDKLQEFYHRKLEEDNLKQKFINLLEKLTSKLTFDEQQQVYSKFTDLEDNQEYNLLNKVRVNLYREDNRINIEDIEEIDYNNQPNYFGDIIYYLFKMNKSSVYNILMSIREVKLNRFIKYLNQKYDDLSELLYEYILLLGLKDNINFYRINKAIGRYILAFDDVSDEQYKKVFDIYTESGLKYLDKLYTDEVLNGDSTIDFKSDEEVFLFYLNKAFNIKENNQKKYVEYLRKAIDTYPAFSKGVEILIAKFKNELNEQDDKLAKQAEKVKENIRELINTGYLDQAQQLINELDEIYERDAEVYSMESIIYIMQGNLKQAKISLLAGLAIEPDNFDLNFNLGYVYESLEENNKAENRYIRSKAYAENDQQLADLKDAFERLDIDKSTESSKEDTILKNEKKMSVTLGRKIKKPAIFYKFNNNQISEEEIMKNWDSVDDPFVSIICTTYNHEK
ncbi:MAG: glycosyltransferase, partial [Nanoarchaeota archaeon]